MVTPGAKEDLLRGFRYPPVTCTCDASGELCPADRAWLQAQRQRRNDERVACGACAAMFPLRDSQRGALAKGQAVYCGACCRSRGTKARTRARHKKGKTW